MGSAVTWPSTSGRSHGSAAHRWEAGLKIDISPLVMPQPPPDCRVGACHGSLQSYPRWMILDGLSFSSSDAPFSVVDQECIPLRLREELLTDPACVFRCCHCVAHSSGVCEDLMVIATWHSLVSKEINGLIASFLQVPQAIALVPSIRKHIKADLAACMYVCTKACLVPRKLRRQKPWNWSYR